MSWLRRLSLTEGWSFLLLMGIAMPLKYAFDQPLAVEIFGWAHGLLFMALCAMAGLAWLRGSLSLKRTAWVGIAALLPFGPFIVDKHLRQWEEG